MRLPAPLRRPAVLLPIAAVALRAPDWGNPVIHVDEQWYLLVGDRMLRGAVPYLDLWDRKPIGLFLLFAGFRLLPGEGILAYQLAATIAAAATALVVAAGARTLGATPRGQVAAGLLYLLGLALLGGRGGQAPVFYNLPMAVAGLLTLRLPGRSRSGIVRSGAIACLLAGVAIQMKYAPVFEGAFFGLAHGWALQRQRGWSATIGAMLGWAVLGVLPTLTAVAWYWRLGALNAWWFANVTSIGLRPGYPMAEWGMRLFGIGAQLSPVAVCAGVSLRRRPRDPARSLMAGWLAAAAVGFVAIGTFFDHYALPLLAPLCIAAAPALGRSTRTLAAVPALAATLLVVERTAASGGEAIGARAVARVVAANSGGECPYVFIGDTATYLLGHACLPTAYAFPNLLAYATERGATGIDEAAEVRRILAGRPPVIVTSDRRLSIWNPDSLRAVKAALARDYALVFTAPHGRWRTAVYLRRDRRFRRPVTYSAPD